ncbi:MAG: diacylglycerol kinase family lipid kinase [Defluviitaleaceae bacterium]|nr:diacylglycerol kinase family lipid kinase [Defluviitaleaceae bacterium]
MTDQNILLVINPVAGRKIAKKLIYHIVDLLCRNNYKTTIFSTGDKGEATLFVKSHASEFAKIICCGGDGTLNEVFTGLIDAGVNIPVGYIPTGTTNDLATALKLTKNPRKAMQISVEGQNRIHDIGVFNDNKYFTYIASFGAFTSVAYRTPQWMKNSLGRVAYFINGVPSIGDIQPHKAKVIADGIEFEGEFVFGSVTNSTIIGGIIKLNPNEVSFDDGLFEVMLVRNPNSPKDLSNSIRCIVNHEYNEEHVLFLRAKEVAFTFDDPTDWTVDGEFAGTVTSACIKNLQGRAEIVVK